MGYFSRVELPRTRFVRLAEDSCLCSGNCYQPKHNRCGCSSKYLSTFRGESCPLAETQSSKLEGKYCELCSCVVSDCLKPRFRGTLCFFHQNVYKGLPENVKLLRSLSDHPLRLWPCDLTHFVKVWPSLCCDFPLAFVVAWAKLPTDRDLILAQAQRFKGNPTTALDLYCGLRHALVSSATACPQVHAQETLLLGRSGGLRTVGLAPLCRCLGVAEATDLVEAPAETRRRVRKKLKVSEHVRLGKVEHVHKLHGNLDILRRLRSSCGGFRLEPVSDGKSFRAALEEIHRYVDDAAGAGVKGLGSYTRGYIIRCIFLAHLAQTQSFIDWGSVSMDQLKAMGPDQSDVLDEFPSEWSALQLSYFCFGRPDWGVFVAMWGCLAREVVLHGGIDATQISALMQQEGFRRSTEAHLEEWGFCNHWSRALREAQGGGDDEPEVIVGVVFVE